MGCGASAAQAKYLASEKEETEAKVCLLAPGAAAADAKGRPPPATESEGRQSPGAGGRADEDLPGQGPGPAVEVGPAKAGLERQTKADDDAVRLAASPTKERSGRQLHGRPGAPQIAKQPPVPSVPENLPLFQQEEEGKGEEAGGVVAVAGQDVDLATTTIGSSSRKSSQGRRGCGCGGGRCGCGGSRAGGAANTSSNLTGQQQQSRQPPPSASGWVHGMGRRMPNQSAVKGLLPPGADLNAQRLPEELLVDDEDFEVLLAGSSPRRTTAKPPAMAAAVVRPVDGVSRNSRPRQQAPVLLRGPGHAPPGIVGVSWADLLGASPPRDEETPPVSGAAPAEIPASPKLQPGSLLSARQIPRSYRGHGGTAAPGVVAKTTGR